MNMEEPKFEMSPEDLERQRKIEIANQNQIIERMKARSAEKEREGKPTRETEDILIKEDVPIATKPSVSSTDAKGHALYHSFRSQNDD